MADGMRVGGGMHQQAATNAEQLTVTLDVQAWNIILTALDELPHKVARQVFSRLLMQLQRPPTTE